MKTFLLLLLVLMTFISEPAQARYTTYKSDPVTRAYRRAERDQRTYDRMAKNPVFKMDKQARTNTGVLLFIIGGSVVALGVGSIIRIKIKESKQTLS